MRLAKIDQASPKVRLFRLDLQDGPVKVRFACLVCSYLHFSITRFSSHPSTYFYMISFI